MELRKEIQNFNLLCSIENISHQASRHKPFYAVGE